MLTASNVRPENGGNGRSRSRVEVMRDMLSAARQVLKMNVLHVPPLIFSRKVLIDETKPLSAHVEYEIDRMAFNLMRHNTLHKPGLMEEVINRIEREVETDSQIIAAVESRQLFPYLEKDNGYREFGLCISNGTVCGTKKGVRLMLLDLLVDSKPGSIGELRGILEHAAERMDLKPFDAVLSLDELATNAYLYGNKKRTDEKIHVVLLLTKDYILIVVEQTGEGILPQLPPLNVLKAEYSAETVVENTERNLEYKNSLGLGLLLVLSNSEGETVRMDDKTIMTVVPQPNKESEAPKE